eukprot:scaffold129761_cov20-Tisochrysis_lutea.AAC.2
MSNPIADFHHKCRASDTLATTLTIAYQVRLVSTGGFIQPSHAQPSSHSAQQQHAQHAHASQ